MGAWQDHRGFSKGTIGFSGLAKKAAVCKNKRCLERAAAATIEPLESRVLLSFTLTAAPDSTSPTTQIDLTYTVDSGYHVELEELAPGDINFHTVTGFAASATSGTYDITGLTPESNYQFRLREDSIGVPSYVYASSDTAPTSEESSDGDGGELAAPFNLSFFGDYVAYGDELPTQTGNYYVGADANNSEVQATPVGVYDPYGLLSPKSDVSIPSGSSPSYVDFEFGLGIPNGTYIVQARAEYVDGLTTNYSAWSSPSAVASGSPQSNPVTISDSGPRPVAPAVMAPT